ncbi:MAG: hypothetical protein ND866_14765 [Pyrinomonadaceae bacterium]|nr:hypothetical protein [Pyrinomonadaceae bacterium]
MKRCSQCDFIYEDDQQLCDMDGQELVYEPTLQSFQIKAATKPSTPSAKLRGRRLVLLAATAVLIGTVLCVGYSGFTSENVPQNSKGASTNVIRVPQSKPNRIHATPAISPAPAVSPTPAPSYSPRSDKTKVTGNRATPLASSISRFPSTNPKQKSARSEPAKANHKKDSGIRGFFKKTGKILKRPFKF